MSAEPVDYADIEHRTMHHPPDADAITCHQAVRDMARSALVTIQQVCPRSEERTLAERKIEEAMMWGNAAIARERG